MTTKTNGTAYGLWALGLVGVGGLHRFYVGRTVTGVLYLFTFNLLFIGLILDFFTIPAMVAEANGGPGGIPAGPPPARMPVSRGKQWAIGIVVLVVFGMLISRGGSDRKEDARRATTTTNVSRPPAAKGAEGRPAAKGAEGRPAAKGAEGRPAEAEEPQDDIERSCGLSPGQHPKFVKRKDERYDVATVRRVQVRISVPPGLSREELRANVCIAALQTYAAAGKGVLGAVAVLAYASEKVDGMYTAAKVDYAPEGDWAKADPKVPLSKWSLNIEFAESYFAKNSKAGTAGASGSTGAEPPEKTRPAADLPVGTYRTKDGYLGALSKEALKKAIELLASEDKEAFAKLLSTNLVFPLKEGLEVTVVDHEGFLASIVKVRKRGTLLEFWTIREALEVP